MGLYFLCMVTSNNSGWMPFNAFKVKHLIYCKYCSLLTCFFTFQTCFRENFMKKFDFEIFTYLCVFRSPEFIYAIFTVMHVCDMRKAYGIKLLKVWYCLNGTFDSAQT